MKDLLTSAVSLALSVLLVMACPIAALADDKEVGESEPYVILDGESGIEVLTRHYEEALAEVENVNIRIADLQTHIDEVEAALPEQQARSDAGLKQRYIMQSNPMIIVDSLLGSETLGDFIRQSDYLERISRVNLEEFNKLQDMQGTLTRARDEQERLRAEADAAAEEARAALTGEQEARAEKQSDAISEAAHEAETQGGKKSVGKKAHGVEQPKDYKEAATQDTEDLSDGADWSMPRDEFIDTWAERIDAYLEGSALEGQGRSFASAAWKHCVDPRWSPAISNTESSKGAVCIRPHNAWGWGAADVDPYGLALEWGSWEEAIDAHVKGLSDGYGYTISISNAQKYCPITWQSWYNKTLAQMSQI